MTETLRHLAPAAALFAALALSWSADARAQEGSGETEPPAEPDGGPQPEERAPGAPPQVYESRETAAWGTAPARPAAEEPSSEKKDEKDEEDLDALAEKCKRIEARGGDLPEECREAELEIVFHGAMRRVDRPVKAVPQASDAETSRMREAPETSSFEAVEPRTEDGKVDLWAVAKREPALKKDEEAGWFGAGLHVGYSTVFGRGSNVAEAYEPVIHAALEGSYQLAPFLQLALVAEIEYLQGAATSGTELKPDSQDDRVREINAILDDYLGVGVRPTVRLDIHASVFEFMTGVGFGWHYFSTSGRWRAKLNEADWANANASTIAQQPRWRGTDEAIYSFSESDHGLYTVIEGAIMGRMLERRLGIGILVEYTIPIHGGIEPDVTIDQSYGVASDPTFTGNAQEYMARENDYGDSFIRHLSSMSLLTFGLIADVRF